MTVPVLIHYDTSYATGKHADKIDHGSLHTVRVQIYFLSSCVEFFDQVSRNLCFIHDISNEAKTVSDGAKNIFFKMTVIVSSGKTF